jgi:hypothetical protein
MSIGQVLFALDESCSGHEALEIIIPTCITCATTTKLQNNFIEAEFEPQVIHSKHGYAQHRR